MKIELNVTETKGTYGVATAYQVKAQVVEQPQADNDFLTGLAALVNGVRIQVPARPRIDIEQFLLDGLSASAADYNDANPRTFGTTGSRQLPQRTDRDGNPLYNELGSKLINVKIENIMPSSNTYDDAKFNRPELMRSLIRYFAIDSLSNKLPRNLIPVKESEGTKGQDEIRYSITIKEE